MQRYSSAFRGASIRRDRPLLMTEMQQFVPSIFSTESHESRSDRFKPISTWEVLQHLEEHAGFKPFMAAQSNVRDVSRKEFTKHMIRLRKEDSRNDSTGMCDEIIIVNANDGTSSYKLLSGQFRFVCANGLVCGDINRNTSVRHSGDARGEVLEGVWEVLKDYDEIHDQHARMQSLRLTDRQRQQFAIASYMAKEGQPENGAFLYNPMQLLNLRRTADNGNDLFSTFNVVQENAINGGLSRLPQVNANGKLGRRTKTKPITNIDNNININRSLWQIASEVLDELTPMQY